MRHTSGSPLDMAMVTEVHCTAKAQDGAQQGVRNVLWGNQRTFCTVCLCLRCNCLSKLVSSGHAHATSALTQEMLYVILPWAVAT